MASLRRWDVNVGEVPPPLEAVAKSLKALNHEGHKGKEKLFFVLFVSFVVPLFRAFCDALLSGLSLRHKCS